MSAQMASINAARGQAQAKWLALAPRERQMITLAAWAVGLTLLFMVGIRPAWRSLQQTPTQLREVNAVLDDMRRQSDEVKALRQMPVVPSSQAEAALHSATQRLGDGAALQMQTDRVNVTLTKVSGARLAEWLQEVRSSARVRPIEAKLIQVTPGVYSGSITLVLTSASGTSR